MWAGCRSTCWTPTCRRTAPEDRDITDQLYGGDLEMRLKQEILLGIGGYRALKALGLEPTVYHMNEGHSAFLALEWAAQADGEAGASTFAEAREVASAGLIFTSHTPVPAGHDYLRARAAGPLLGRVLQTARAEPRRSFWRWAGRTRHNEPRNSA